MSKKRNNQFNSQATTEEEVVTTETTETETTEEVVDVVESEVVETEVVVAVETVEPPAPPVEEVPVIEAPLADAGVLAQPPSFAAAQAATAPVAQTNPEQKSKDIELLNTYLDSYATEIEKPETKNATSGARCQLGFYRLIYGVLASKTEFAAKFETLLEFMRKHSDGVCSPRNIFRYYPSLPTDAKNAADYLTVTQFCSTLSAAKTPEAAAKQVDVGRLLSKLNNDQITHNVTAWFR